MEVVFFIRGGVSICMFSQLAEVSGPCVDFVVPRRKHVICDGSQRTPFLSINADKHATRNVYAHDNSHAGMHTRVSTHTHATRSAFFVTYFDPHSTALERYEAF